MPLGSVPKRGYSDVVKTVIIQVTEGRNVVTAVRSRIFPVYHKPVATVQAGQIERRPKAAGRAKNNVCAAQSEPAFQAEMTRSS